MVFQGQSRPGQNKRMRGRNNNNNHGGNRKGPNPLTRSYESNGPDVKIRGTAQHVGEKYLQLARDAQTSGDPVAAESYLQHAEHYFRIIAAAQQAQYQAQAGYVRQPGDIDADDGDDDDDSGIPDRFALPSERTPPAPPPYVAPVPVQSPVDRPFGQDRTEGQERPYRQDRFNGDRDQRQDRDQRPDRDTRQDRDQRPDRGGFQERTDRYPQEQRVNGERTGQERGPSDGNRNPRPDRDQRPDRNRNRFVGEPRDGRDPQFRDQPRIPAIQQPLEARPQPAPQPPAPESDAGAELPAFITAPVRVQPPVTDAVATPVASASDVEAPSEPVAAIEDGGTEAFAVRPRRRRRTRLASNVDGERAADAPVDTPEE